MYVNGILIDFAVNQSCFSNKLFAFALPLSFSLSLAIILYCPNGGYNHKILFQSLITNQGPFNSSYETHWPFNAENTPRLMGD